MGKDLHERVNWKRRKGKDTKGEGEEGIGI